MTCINYYTYYLPPMFKLIENKKIGLLGVNAMSFVNEKFSCQHIHLDCESPEKAFVVAFRTIPNDDLQSLRLVLTRFRILQAQVK